MGGLFSREQSQTPQIVPGFEFLPGLLQQLVGTAQQKGSSGPFVAGADQGEQDFLASVQALDIPGLLGSGFQSLQDIAGGSQFDAAAPGLSRLLDVGSANLNEQAALGGVLSSSGAAQNQADFTANTVAQLQQSLAPIQAQAASTLASPQTAGIGGQAFGKERGIADTGIQRGLQNTQFNQGLIPALMQGLGSGASGTPVFQPTTGPSKFESLLGTVAPVAGAAGGAKVGNSSKGSNKGP